MMNKFYIAIIFFGLFNCSQFKEDKFDENEFLREHLSFFTDYMHGETTEKRCFILQDLEKDNLKTIKLNEYKTRFRFDEYFIKDSVEVDLIDKLIENSEIKYSYGLDNIVSENTTFFVSIEDDNEIYDLPCYMGSFVVSKFEYNDKHDRAVFYYAINDLDKSRGCLVFLEKTEGIWKFERAQIIWQGKFYMESER